MAVADTDEVSAEALYNALLSDYPDNLPGTRPVHAIGIGAIGFFAPSTVAGAYSAAPHFAGGRVPVTVRYSNGSGSRVERDHDLDVRGMSVKFHFANDIDADLIMITLPVFFAKDPRDFLHFAQDGVPKRAHSPSWLAKLIAKLQLHQPDPDLDPGQTTSGEAGVVRYVDRVKSARPGFVAATMLPTPTSFARATYHALHTFKLTDSEGVVRYARFTWEPVAGGRPENNSELPDNYLRAELGRRIARTPTRFVLRMVLAQQGDDLDDPTVLWDTTRPRIVLGELTLTGLIDSAETEKLSFNPTRVVPGFECSDDPILAARGWTYAFSCTKRGGHGCPVMKGDA